MIKQFIGSTAKTSRYLKDNDDQDKKAKGTHRKVCHKKKT